MFFIILFLLIEYINFLFIKLVYDWLILSLLINLIDFGNLRNFEL